MNKKDCKLVFVGPFSEHSGYSYINRSFLEKFNKNGWDVGIETMHCNMELTKTEMEHLHKFRKYNDHGQPTLFHDDRGINSNIIKMLCWIPLSSIPQYKHNIMYTMMETRYPAEIAVKIINSFYNSCWVPNEFFKNSFIEGGVKIPIHAVPTGINFIDKKRVLKDVNFNFKMFRKGKDVVLEKPKGYKFLSVFRWTFRKGFDVLLKSYLKEFKDSDNVSLVIVSRHIASTFKKEFYNAVEHDIRKHIEKYGNENSPPVYWCHDNIHTDLMSSVYNYGDGFVLPSRGEGICYPPLEATMHGLPTILPYHTGFTDYVSDQTSYKFEVDEWIKCNEVPEWHGWITKLYFAQEFPKFGEKTIEELSFLMRRCMDNREEGQIKRNNLLNLIKEKYNWDKCYQNAEQILIENIEK